MARRLFEPSRVLVLHEVRFLFGLIDAVLVIFDDIADRAQLFRHRTGFLVVFVDLCEHREGLMREFRRGANLLVVPLEIRVGQRILKASDVAARGLVPKHPLALQEVRDGLTDLVRELIYANDLLVVLADEFLPGRFGRLGVSPLPLDFDGLVDDEFVGSAFFRRIPISHAASFGRHLARQHVCSIAAHEIRFRRVFTELLYVGFFHVDELQFGKIMSLLPCVLEGVCGVRAKPPANKFSVFTRRTAFPPEKPFIPSFERGQNGFHSSFCVQFPSDPILFPRRFLRCFKRVFRRRERIGRPDLIRVLEIGNGLLGVVDDLR